MNFESSCSAGRINLNLPHLIWEMETGDNSGSVLITRVLHNKPSFIIGNYSDCYLSYLSPELITYFFGLFGLALFLLGLYFLISKKRWLPILILLVVPLFSIFDFPKSYLLRGLFVFFTQLMIIFYGLHFSVISFKSNNFVKKWYKKAK